ncbi:hemagglutinin repeat-containing protein [Corticimicrobacter populi]|uniref:Filamentous haemagglutinin FhaB/tRNA nuclease CdiA-like TPS domain-containing protein n=1 Tax=Corticimicrobacter populi TaxID=2175229 RepID=A0A2V1K5G8_9BURK|nr:hemagglutinin repeat-containing protein [Corticimicrobacter populi]PWF24685.1 hypothetical protein DD235_00340 [Corticimicrobacter populi]
MTKLRSAAAWLVIFTQVWSPVLAQTLPITVDRSVSGPKPIVGVSNGVPVVNIAPPSAAGVSNNRFTQFNAGPSGVVLNNSGGASQTQLAGQIAGNPMLGNQRATVILNQVTAANPSRLMGMVEVAGQRANVIVANPAGITCDGCGFLNAGQATLTTGRPRIGADGIQGFDIAGGRIGIEGQGLYGDNLSRVDLLARTLEVNAKVWADRLNVVAGAAQVDYDNLAVRRGTGEGTAPAVALDVAALGGMYANSIRLIGTEAGLGVNVGGDLVAMTGDLQLSANGDVRIRPSGRLQATGNIAAQAGGGLDNAGAVAAGRELTLDVGGKLSNTGGMSAARQVVIEASALDNRGTLAAGLRADGSVGPEGLLQVQTAGLSNRGLLVAGGDVVATAGTIDQSGGRMVAGQNLTLAADGRIANTGGTLAAGSRLDARGQVLTNTDGVVAGERVSIRANEAVGNVRGVVQADDALQIDSVGRLDNRQGELYGRSLAVETGTLDNAAGRMAAREHIRIEADHLGNDAGQVSAGQTLALAVGEIDNGGLLYSAGTLALDGQSLNNRAGGEILAAGNNQLDISGTLASRGVIDGAQTRVQAGSVDNAGRLQGDRVDLRAGALRNAGGAVLASRKGMDLGVAALDNDGTVRAGQDLALDVAGKLANAGQLSAAGRINAEAAALDNRGTLAAGLQSDGSLGAEGDLQIRTAVLSSRGILLAGGDATAVADAMDLSGGKLATGQSLNLEVAGNLANLGGTVSAGSGLGVRSQALNNTDGTLAAGGRLDLQTGALGNAGGHIEAETATLEVEGAVDSRGGLILADNGLRIRSASIDNTAGRIGAGQTLEVATTQLDNARGNLSARDSARIDADSLRNDAGQISVGTTLTLTTDALDNAGLLHSAGDLKLDARSLTNRAGGEIVTAGENRLEIAGALVNQGLVDGGQTHIQAADVSNAGRMYGDQVGITTGDLRNATGAVLAARQGMTLDVASLTNDGAVEAGRDLTLGVAGKLSNTGGLSAAGRIEVDAGRIENRGTLAAGLQDDGSLGAEGDLQIRTAAVSNSGILLAGGDASVVADTMDLSGGKLVAGQALTLQTGGTLANAGGTLAAGDRLDVQASALDNTDGVVSGEGVSIRVNETITNVRGVVQSGQQLDLSGAGQLDNRNGRVLADSGRIEAGSLDNRSGIVQADGALQLISAGEVSNRQGKLYGGELSVTAEGLNNSAGRLIGTESLDLIARQQIDNTDGTLAAGGRLDLQTGALGNAGGHIEAETAALEVEGAVDNRGGLILADNGLRIRSVSIDNRNTLGAAGESARGIVGGTVDLAAVSINNTAGRIGAGQTLEVATTQLDNARGNLSARDSARIDADSLRNDAGQVSVGTTLALTTDALDNAGLLHSAGDLKLDARSLTNRAGGEIVTAGENRLEIAGALINQGLIDGGQTHIQAADVSSAGRMYGDQVGITTGDLRNATGAVLAARQGMTLDVASLTNDGAVEAGRDLTLGVAGKLSNTGGLSAAGRIEVDAGRIENRGTLAAGLQDDGSLGAEGDLQIRTAVVSNSGILLAGGEALVVADTIDLSGGKLVAGQALTLQTEGELRNVRGAAHGATVSVQADRLDNAAGRIGSDGALDVVTNGSVSNVAGTLAAGDRLDVQASALDNTDGVVSGEGVSIRVNETITNVRGVVQSGQQLDLSSAGQLDNRNGRVLADSGRIEAGSLDNRSGIVQADGALQLISAGEVNNQRGELYGGVLSVTAAGLDNSAGRLIGTESLDLIARRRIDNTDGTLAAGGRLDVQTGVLGNVRGRIEAQAMALEVDGALDNRNGLILADNGLRIRAASIDNRDTLNASAKGVMGGAVDLAADAIDNRAGRIGASQSLDIVTASLDNIRGQVASNGRARIEATRLGNDTGLISAGTALTLATDRIDNQGRLHSGGDLTLDVRSLTNRASGEIVAAGVNRLNVSGVLENQGLIDGGHTRIQAATVNNTGRLYGDRISIGAGELRNEPGAVIASRGDMDLGIGTLTNRERALIFADGDLAIGGALDAASRAAGSARSLINASATIEATGHADIAAASIRNLNNHFESEVVEISREPKLYYRLENSTELMDGSKMWLCDQRTNECGREPLSFLWGDASRRLLLPSERYPESQYGPPFNYVPWHQGLPGVGAPIPLAYIKPSFYCNGGDNGGDCHTSPEILVYANDSAVWAIFDLDYPGPPPEFNGSISSCVGDLTRECLLNYERLVSEHSEAVKVYKEKNLELDRRIRAFNADFKNRLVENFFYYKVDEIVSESRVVSTDPGRIIAGGDMRLSGTVLNDKSTIIAGHTLSIDGPAIVNQGAEGERIVARVGQEVRTVVGGKKRRHDGSAYNDVIAPERIELAAASTTQHAGAPLSGQNTPGASSIAGASISSPSTGANVPGAQSVQVSGGPLAASIAKGIDTQGGQPAHGVTGPLDFAATSQAGVPGVEKEQSGGLRAAALARGIGTQGSGAASGVADPMVPATSSDGSQQASAVATGIGMSGVQPGPRAPAVVIDISASGAQTVRVVTLQPQVPQNAMYSVVQRPDAPYLIATDAQFTGQRQSVSSDFMLQQLNQDPEHILKRLGDGFYEQRLVAEQVMLATGQRFVGDYTDNESQYKALLGAGVDFAHKLGLNVGTALTDEQLRHMTSDMVWLVEQTVTLPDGTQQQVLAPQVYLAVKPGDLRGDGTLIAGRDTSIRVDGDAVNTGTLGARNAVVVEAGNIRNTVGSVQGRTVNLAAREDIDNLAGLIRGDTVTLAAGRDVNLQASTRSQASGGVSSTRLDGVARIDAGTLNVQAGQDFNAEAAAVSVAESARIQAGRDINLTTAEERYAESYNYGKRNRAEMRTATDMGTRIDAGSDLTLIAGRDVAAIAAEVAAGGRLAVGAERDITVAAGDQSGYAYNETYYKKRGFMSSRSVHTIVSSDWTDSVSSTFTGDSAVLMAGRDLLVAGSNVAAQHDLIMSADRNVAVTAAANSLEEYEYRRVKKSGFGALGGISYGSRRTTDSLDTQRGLHTGSTLGSVEGDVLVNAGASLGVLGSDILASKGDITLVGRDVTVAGLADTMRQREFHEVKQSGLTVTASNPVVDAMQTGMRMADAAGKVDNPVMQGLAGATTVLAASNAYDAVNAARNAANPGALSQIGGVSIKISLGSSQSSSTTDRSMTSNTGANVAAGRDLTVLARGAGEASDITVQGANLSAGRDAVLKAEGDIQLQAARNVFEQHTDSKSSGASIGVGLSFGGATNGLTLELGVNAARGRQDGRDVTWSNAHVAAGNTLALQSGGDISLQGASAKADRIIASAGGNLLLASLQEISEYTSRQRSGGIGVSICVPPLCAGASSAWANASTGRMDSDFESVTKQTGLWAGDGGFQIDVGGRTSLTGSVIASSDQAIAEGRNRLSTGTLETDDIRNKASYSASQVSVGGSFGFGGSTEGAGSPADQGAAKDNQGTGSGLTMNAPTVVAASGSGSSTTRSAISEGEIEIRDEAGQQALTGQTGAETIAALDRDTSDTLNALRPIFDKEKIEAGFEIAGEASRQVGQFLTNRAREADAEVKNLEQQLAQERSRQPGQQDGQRIAVLEQQLQDAQGWLPGGDQRLILTAVTAALSGNVTGSGAEVLRAASVNYLQGLTARQVKLIADSLDSEVARTALHAVAGCAGAAAQGAGCGSGALGAASSVVLNNLLSQLESSSGDALSPSEKEARVNLIKTLVAGVTAAAGGDAAAATVAAALETENNYLTHAQVDGFANRARECESRGDCEEIIKEMENLSVKQQDELMALCSVDSQACQARYGDLVAERMLLREAMDRLMASDAVPSGMKNDMPALLFQQLEIEGVINQQAFADELMARYDVDESQAMEIASAALSALGTTIRSGIRGRGPTSALPVPEPVSTPHGMYKSNPKHTLGQRGSGPNAGVEPRNSLALFEKSVPDPSGKGSSSYTRYAVDESGNVHRFFSSNGEYHWSGSTGDALSKLRKEQIPIEIRRLLGVNLK